jgi:hypothetical protein
MLEPKTPKDIQVFNSMVYFLSMLSITKLLQKIEVFHWTPEYQQVWEAIKQ